MSLAPLAHQPQKPMEETVQSEKCGDDLLDKTEGCEHVIKENDETLTAEKINEGTSIAVDKISGEVDI